QCPTLQGYSAEYATGSRPREDIGPHRGVRLRGHIPANWARRRRRLTPQSELARQHPFHPVFAHDQQDEVGFLSANLQAESAAFHSQSCGRAPSSTWISARCKAAAVFSREDKSGLLHVGN